MKSNRLCLDSFKTQTTSEDFSILVKLALQKTHPTGLQSESHFSFFQLCQQETLTKPTEPLSLGRGRKEAQLVIMRYSSNGQHTLTISLGTHIPTVGTGPAYQ